MTTTVERLPFTAGRSTVELDCAFDEHGRLISISVVPPTLNDENVQRLARRLEAIGRKLSAEEHGLGPLVADALAWWQIAERLQLIERDRVRRGG